MEIGLKGCYAMINDKPVNEYFLVQKASQTMNLAEAPVILSADNYGFAVKKGNKELLDALNKGYDAVCAEGIDKKIYENDPFAKIDQIGVGKLVKMACQLGRATRPELHLGVCGEHGGDPSSVEFFHRTGLDYVSCSPFRVPIARLAAAQAAIKSR